MEVKSTTCDHLWNVVGGATHRLPLGRWMLGVRASLCQYGLGPWRGETQHHCAPHSEACSDQRSQASIAKDVSRKVGMLIILPSINNNLIVTTYNHKKTNQLLIHHWIKVTLLSIIITILSINSNYYCI